MTEERKNENVIVEMPKKIKDKYITKREKIRLKNTRFFQISMNVVKANKALAQLQKEMDDMNTSMQDDVNRSVKKLKLEKRKDYRWKIDAQNGRFIGIPIKTKTEEPKKENK